MSSRREDLGHVVAVLKGSTRNALLNALKELAEVDADFNGENDGYLWNESEKNGFESNVDYAIDVVKDIPKDEDLVEKFISLWMEKDGYYGQTSIEIIKKNDKIIALSLAYTYGC